MIVLITGCRSGFGKLAALEAARAGHTVYAGFRDLDTAGPLAEAAGDLPVVPVQLDVTSADDRKTVVARILEKHGRIDALVNNAGIALAGFLEQLDEDEIRKIFEVNVFGAWALTREVLPAMRAQREGIVINVSSMAGRFPLPGLGGYASSKWALEGMSEVWRHELRPWGVRVVLIEPGPYKTDILERNRRVGRNVEDPDSPWAPMVQRVLEMEEREVPKRAGDPMDVARRIVALLGHENPRLRHPMGSAALAREVIKRLTPFAVVEAIIGRVVNLPGPS